MYFYSIDEENLTEGALVALAEKYGFAGNLRADATAFLLATAENPFSLACEGHGIPDGTIADIARKELACIRRIFMRKNESDDSGEDKNEGENTDTNISKDIVGFLENYTPSRLDFNPNFAVGEVINEFAGKLISAADDEAFFKTVCEFYREHGAGIFGMYKAFRVKDIPEGIAAPGAAIEIPYKKNATEKESAQGAEKRFRLIPISGMECVRLSDLIGYELQKKKLIDNTEAFVAGKKANNVLLYGDSGTGKSSSIKAIVNEYAPRGLRLVEVYKHQLSEISDVIATLRNRNYKFIIYMDDLSFEEFETDYKYLKAVIEGDVETRPDNVLIYATSNRRHIIKETWKDRDDVEMNNGIHKSDTMQEKLSLFHRFGITIGYMRPSRDEYFDIVKALAKREGLSMPEKELLAGAVQWELSHGGISGRAAVQYVYYLLGQ